VRIKIIGTENVPDSPALIQNDNLFPRTGLEYITPLVEIECESLPSDPARQEKLETVAKETLTKGEVDLVVIFRPEFREYMERLAETEVGSKLEDDLKPEEQNGISVVMTRSRDQSQIAYARWDTVVELWQQEWVATKLRGAGFDPRLVRPLSIAPVDVAPESARKAIMWSKILPFVMLIWALSGAFYPAVDLCAGEKERGTLETLLSSPARRREIVWGKLLTIIVFSCMTALLNLTSIQITASMLGQQFANGGARGLADSLGTPPIYAIGWLVLTLIPMAAFFSALALAVAALARSTKEGQYYLMPLLLLTLPFVMIPMLPGIELSLGTCLIPITGMVLLSRALIEGQYLEAIRYLPLVAAVTVACCLLSIRWAVRQFESESVMFRENERWDLRTWLNSIWRERGETASVMEAMLCGLIILVARFFASLASTSTSVGTWQDLSIMLLVSQIALILTPTLLMALILTRSVRTSLRLDLPNTKHLLICVILAVCFHPLAMWFASAIQYVYPISDAVTQSLKGIDQAWQSQSFLWAFLLMALLPAVCEETAFRGFIFGGLLRQNGVLRAILVSAIFFGFTHGLLQQSISATFVGLLFGWIAWRTGGIACTILMHAIHNGLTLFLAKCSRQDTTAPWMDWFVQFENGGFQYEAAWTTISIAISVVCMWLIYQQSGNEILKSESYAEDRPIAE
jgi:sodium transport system permease protein